jgi:hypothetical protein
VIGLILKKMKRTKKNRIGQIQLKLINIVMIAIAISNIQDGQN